MSSRFRPWRPEILIRTLGLFALCALFSGAPTGCGDDGDNSGSGNMDMPDPDDMDGDEWPNERDNCPITLNFEQRDRDQDGVGDVCDVCPATPNGTDDACQSVAEQEPNGPSEPQSISLVEMGRLREVTGTVEAPSLGEQSVDVFEFEADAQTLLEVRAARSSPESSLQPLLEVTYAGSEPFAPRRAEGRFEARRQLYIPRTGRYRVLVSDRRGIDGEQPVGSMNDSYAFSVRRLPAPQVSDITLPVEEEVVGFDDPRNIRVLEANFSGNNFALLATETLFGNGERPFGIDTILLVEMSDGTILENDDVGSGLPDSRITIESPVPGPVRIVLDHRNFDGLLDRDYDVTLVASEFETLPEVEPNDQPDVAASLRYPSDRGERETTQAEIGLPVGDPPVPDPDVFKFQGSQGDILSISVQGVVNMEPVVELFVLEGENEQPIVETRGFSQPSVATIRLVLPETREYFLRINEATNLETGMNAPPPEGGPLWAYNIVIDNRPFLSATSLSTTGGPVSSTFEQDGTLRTHNMLPSTPSIVDVEVNRNGTSNQISPFLEIWDIEVEEGTVFPTERLAAGERRLAAFVPSEGINPYPLTVYNGNGQEGSPGFNYTLDVSFEPVTPMDEGEPNDVRTEATPIGSAPAVVTGDVAADQPDWFEVDLTAGSEVSFFASGRSEVLLALYNPSGQVVASGPVRLLDFQPQLSDTYLLQIVSGPAPSDYTLIVTD